MFGLWMVGSVWGVFVIAWGVAGRTEKMIVEEGWRIYGENSGRERRVPKVCNTFSCPGYRQDVVSRRQGFKSLMLRCK